MTKEEFYSKLDEDISTRKIMKKKYLFLFSIHLPCGIKEFEKRYFQYSPEIRKCNICNPPKYDIILNLQTS
jgi:hypothetical protein